MKRIKFSKCSSKKAARNKRIKVNLNKFNPDQDITTKTASKDRVVRAEVVVHSEENVAASRPVAEEITDNTVKDLLKMKRAARPLIMIWFTIKNHKCVVAVEVATATDLITNLAVILRKVFHLKNADAEAEVTEEPEALTEETDADAVEEISKLRDPFRRILKHDLTRKSFSLKPEK